MCAMRSAGYAGSTGRYAAPVRVTAQIASTDSTERGSATATSTLRARRRARSARGPAGWRRRPAPRRSAPRRRKTTACPSGFAATAAAMSSGSVAGRPRRDRRCGRAIRRARPATGSAAPRPAVRGPPRSRSSRRRKRSANSSIVGIVEQISGKGELTQHARGCRSPVSRSVRARSNLAVSTSKSTVVTRSPGSSKLRSGRFSNDSATWNSGWRACERAGLSTSTSRSNGTSAWANACRSVLRAGRAVRRSSWRPAPRCAAPGC